ncbi:alpha/beta hydrolase [Promicromonospora panici]|uniref:alpha/beta hydrolase n=1 Tax=Promicromonospora panici TaxID=2219658 RepID=UPI00101E08D1|nr:alpha/beta hydrolase [Promicromonospora panici]
MTTQAPAPGRRRRIARMAVVPLALIALLATAGAVYEGVAARDDVTRYPMPGRMVDVGGHRLHLHCTGTGEPTVVLEAGLGESSAGWATIQERLAGDRRVCGYDRAGYAWSEPGPGPRTAGQAADELHAMLLASGEPGPYVFVAHSYGGHVVRLYADRWPDRTAGMVLIDVSDENATTALTAARVPLTAQFAVQRGAAHLGVIRLFGAVLVPDDAPAPTRQAVPVVYGPGTLATAGAEVGAGVDSAEQVQGGASPGAWGDRPTTVIAAGGQPEAAVEALRRVAEQSSRGCLVVAGTTDHYVHYAEPDLVVSTVRDLGESGC